MNEITISNNKTLKLTNALSLEVNMSETQDMSAVVLKMENYLKTKGAMPIGPLIQKTVYNVSEQGELDIHVIFIRQSNNFIHNVEEPYKMDSQLRIQNCMYAHYVGPEEKLKLAFDKINVTAFENEINLSNENYTIFVNKQDDDIIADIFAEKKSDE